MKGFLRSLTILAVFIQLFASGVPLFGQQDRPQPGSPSISAPEAGADGSVTQPRPPLTAEEKARLQEQRDADAAAGAAGCAACGGSLLAMMVGIVALIALNFALLIWVARDAKSRGMDSSILWMFLVMFTGPIGLLIYIFSRPQGELAICSNCKGKRLKASATCPHCHHN